MCRYQSDDECKVRVEVRFFNDKEEWVHIRGSPYSASFKEGTPASDNLLNGSAMERQIKKELERLQGDLTNCKKETITKDKDLKDVKVLLTVKDNVDQTMKNTNKITLDIDQLDEALKLFVKNKQAKDSQVKQFTKVNKDWNDLKTQIKNVKKEIAPLVANENEKNNGNIKKLEEDILQFT